MVKPRVILSQKASLKRVYENQTKQNPPISKIQWIKLFALAVKNDSTIAALIPPKKLKTVPKGILVSLIANETVASPTIKTM